MTIPNPSDEVSRIMRLMPACWRDDYRIAWATDAARANRALALDQAPPRSSFDADVHRFFQGGRDQMPMTSAPSAAMPASLSPDNFTGSRGAAYIRRAADQSEGEEELLDMVSQALARMSAEAQARFIDGLNRLLSGGNNTRAEAEDDNGEGSPMQFGGQGQGSSPADLIVPGSSLGTFAETDPLRNAPRGAADSRPRTLRQRRQLVQDHAAGIAHVSPAERHRGFAARFPDACRVDVWG